jgi:acetyl-CoA synthetase
MAAGSLGPNRASLCRASRALDGLPGERGLNIAHEAVDRHAAGDRAGCIALRCLGKDESVRDLTYAELSAQTSRFANVLRSLGVGKGDRVFVLAGRIPELYVAALGTLKNRSVFCPLFSAFGPEPIRARLAIGQGRVLLTTAALYRKKIAGIRSATLSADHRASDGHRGGLFLAAFARLLGEPEKL